MFRCLAVSVNDIGQVCAIHVRNRNQSGQGMLLLNKFRIHIAATAAMFLLQVGQAEQKTDPNQEKRRGKVFYSVFN